MKKIATTELFELRIKEINMNKIKLILILIMAMVGICRADYEIPPDSNYTWHVAKDGNDDQGGHSYGQADLTIGASVTAASNGSIIILWPGDYNEPVDLDAANKSVEIVGVSRQLSRIKHNSEAKGIRLENNCSVKNLSVNLITSHYNAVGIYSPARNNIVIEDCDVIAPFDGLGLSNCSNIIVRRCNVRGHYDALMVSNAFRVIMENCTFYADGTYDTTVDCRAVYDTGGSTVIFNNCIFKATRADESAKITAAVQCDSDSLLIFNNCIFEASAGANDSNNVYGVYTRNASANIILNGCIFRTSTAGSGTAYDLYNYAGDIYVVNTNYDTAKTYGTITDLSPIP